MTTLADSQASCGSESQDWVQPVPELFDPLGLTATLSGQWMYLPSVAAAFIMQSMHPVIGDVTDRYSLALTDPIGRGIRSFDAVQQWTFGGKAAIELGYWLRALHRPLQMQGETGSGRGKHISALDPEAYGWVVATEYVTSKRIAPWFLGRELTDDEDEQLFRDNRVMARLTQVPERGYPRTRAEFDAYYDRMVGEVLVAHPQLVENLDLLVDPVGVLAGPLAAVVKPMGWPVSRLSRLLAFGAMDQRVRDILGVEWSEREERDLRTLFTAYRAAYRVLPERVTFAPLAYHARQHQRALDKMRGRALKSFTAHDKGEPVAVRRAQHYANSCQ